MRGDGSTQREGTPRSSEGIAVLPFQSDRPYNPPERSSLHLNSQMNQQDTLHTQHESHSGTTRQNATIDRKLVGVRGLTVNGQQLNSSVYIGVHATNLYAEHGLEGEGDPAELAARVRSGTFAVHYPDNNERDQPRQQIVIGQIMESPSKSTVVASGNHASLPSLSPPHPAGNLQENRTQTLVVNVDQKCQIVKKKVVIAVEQESEGRVAKAGTQVKLYTQPASPTHHTKALPTSHFCPHRSSSPVRSKYHQYKPQEYERARVPALKRDWRLHSSGFRSKKSPFVDTFKRRQILNQSQLGTRGNLNLNGKSIGNQDSARQESPGHLRRQATKLNSESGQELSLHLDAFLSASKLQSDTVVVQDARLFQSRYLDQQPGLKPNLQALQKPLNKVNTANLTLNEDSQGTLQIPAPMLREQGYVIDQLQTQLLSTQTMHLEKKDSNSLKKTGFNTNSLKHLEQQIMNKISPQGRAKQVKVVEGREDTQGISKRKSVQLRKLASSGSAETSGDLHLSEHCGDQQRAAHHHTTTQTKNQDVQTRDVATKLSHVELHVEDLAHAESVQDQIRTLSHNASKIITLDMSRPQLKNVNQEPSGPRQAEIVEQSGKLVINSSMDKLETPDLTAEMEPRGAHRTGRHQQTARLREGQHRRIIDQKIIMLSREAAMRQKRLSKQHNIPDPKLTIRSYSQDSKGSTERRERASPSSSKLMRDLRAPGANFYLLQSPSLVDKILANEYYEKLERREQPKITASAEPRIQPITCSWRQDRAPLKVKEGNFEGLQTVSGVQVVPTRSPPPHLQAQKRLQARQKRSIRVKIQADTRSPKSPGRKPLGSRQDFTNREDVSSSQLLDPTAVEHENVLAHGIAGHYVRAGVTGQSTFASTFYRENQTSFAHVTGHISSHKAFKPANIQKSLEKLKSLGQGAGDERASADYLSGAHTGDFRAAARDNSGKLNADISTLEKGIQNNLNSPVLDFLPNLAIYKNQMHSTSVRNMASGLDARLNRSTSPCRPPGSPSEARLAINQPSAAAAPSTTLAASHGEQGPTGCQRPEDKQEFSRHESLYRPGVRDGVRKGQDLAKQHEKTMTMGAQTSMTNINIKDSNNRFETTKELNENFLALHECNVLVSHPSDRIQITNQNVNTTGQVSPELQRSEVQDSKAGLHPPSAPPEPGNKTQKSAEGQTGGATAIPIADHESKYSKETLESPVGRAPSGIGNGGERKIQEPVVATTPENHLEPMAKQQRGDLVARIVEQTAREQHQRGPAAALVLMSSDPAVPQSPRRAIIEKPSRQPLLVNINNEEMGPQKSEVTLRHSQSSERQSPMKHAYLANSSTQRQFSPRAVNYKQILQGKYLAQQATSQDSGAFLNSIKDMKDLVPPREEKGLVSTTAFDFCSAQKLVVQKHTQSEETLVLQAEPVQGLQDHPSSQQAAMPQISRIDFDESRDKQVDETFYKSKALINHLQRNHNFGGVLKENRLKKSLKTNSLESSQHQASTNIDKKEKEDRKKLHRKLIKEFNSQFCLNLGEGQSFESQGSESPEIATSVDRPEEEPVAVQDPNEAQNQKSNRVIALSRSRKGLHDNHQEQQTSLYESASPASPARVVLPAIDSVKKPGQFSVPKSTMDPPPTETAGTGNSKKQGQGRQAPVDATTYNVGIINIVQFGSGSKGQARPKVETKEANELTTQTEYRQVPDQQPELYTNFSNSNLEAADQRPAYQQQNFSQSQNLSKMRKEPMTYVNSPDPTPTLQQHLRSENQLKQVAPSTVAEDILKLKQDGQEHGGDESRGAGGLSREDEEGREAKEEEEKAEDGRQDEDDAKSPHFVPSSIVRSMNKSPSAQTTPKIASCRPPASEVTSAILRKGEKPEESLLDETFLRLDQHNLKAIEAQNSEDQNEQRLHDPGTALAEARKASIAFTLAGPDSVYAEDNKLNLNKKVSEVQKNELHLQELKDNEEESMTRDNRPDHNTSFDLNQHIVVRPEAANFKNTFTSFHPPLRSMVTGKGGTDTVYRRNDTVYRRHGLKNVSIQSVHSDEPTNQWLNSATPKGYGGRELKSKGHPSITEYDSEVTSHKSPIKARFYAPFRPQQIKIDNRTHGRPQLPKFLPSSTRESNDWSVLQRALANGKDPFKLLRQQELTRASMLPPITQAAATPTNMSSTLTPPDQHQRNLSFEDPAIPSRAGRNYLNRLTEMANTRHVELKKQLSSVPHSPVSFTELANKQSPLLASTNALSPGLLAASLNREQLNRTVAAHSLRSEAHRTMTQIEELTKNMRRLKPYKRRAQASMLQPWPATLEQPRGASLKVRLSGTIERDVGKSERKIEKIQREFREFEEQLAFTAAEQLRHSAAEDLMASTSGSFVVRHGDSRESVLPSNSMPPIHARSVLSPSYPAQWPGH